MSRQPPYGIPHPHMLTNESCTAALTSQHSRLLHCSPFKCNASTHAWHEFIKSTPFLLNSGQQPYTPLSTGLQELSTVPLAKSFVSEAVEAVKEAKHYLEMAQQHQKKYYDQGRKELTLKVGAQVLLNTRNIRWKGSTTPKLMPRWIGPLVVKAVGPVAYKLDLPKNLHIHSVFHVQLLKQYKFGGRHQPPPLPVELEDDFKWFQVERVCMHREQRVGRAKKKIRRRYLVKWLW